MAEGKDPLTLTHSQFAVAAEKVDQRNEAREHYKSSIAIARKIQESGFGDGELSRHEASVEVTLGNLEIYLKNVSAGHVHLRSALDKLKVLGERRQLNVESERLMESIVDYFKKQ